MTIDDVQAIDTESRELIVNKTDQNFFVEAGAGSGKTTVLVSRMISMVENGIDVSKICAITFTKAAANEFYDRFQKELIKRSTAETDPDYKKEPGKLGNPTDLSRQRCFDALQNIDLCFMGTIDSFCNMILSEHPVEAKIPSVSAVVDDEEIKEVYIQEYTRIRKGEYGEELKKLLLEFQKYHSNPETAFVQILVTLMRTRSAKVILPTTKTECINKKYSEQKKAIIKLEKELQENPGIVYTNYKKSVEAAKNLSFYRFRIEKDWDENPMDIYYALNGIKDLRLNPYEDLDKYIPYFDLYFQPHSPSNSEKISWYELRDDFVKEVMKQIEENKYNISMHLALSSLEAISGRLRKEGKLTFFDYLLYLRDMLKKDASEEGKMIRHINERHRYFMIDEFQDTDPMQAEIFFYLAAKDIKPDWHDCVPLPGSLFIVGDPKQSIYRFRNADVSSYLSIKKMFMKEEVGRVLYLSRNFRSTNQMCTYFNEEFGRLLPENTEDQSKFEWIPMDVEKEESASTFGGVYFYDVSSGKDAEEEEKEPYIVSEMLRKLVNNPNYRIKGKGDTAEREITYRDIMLITPGKEILQQYADRFTKDDIPYYVEGRIVFSESEALKTTICLYNSIVSENESPYLYASLKSDLFSVSENGLANLKKKHFSFKLNEKFEELEIDEEIKVQLRTLFAIKKEAYQHTPSSLFDKILNTFNLFACCGVKNIEYVFFVLELLREAEAKREIITLQDGGKYLNRILNDEEEIERCISLSRQSNRVHLANIHKVKGLEAPIVILACPKNTGKALQMRVEQKEEGSECYIFNISTENHNSIRTHAFENKEEREKESLAAERVRLLYVAATRARNALIIARKLKKDGDLGASLWNPLLQPEISSITDQLKEEEVHNREKGKAIPADILYSLAEDNVIDKSNSALPTYKEQSPSKIEKEEIVEEELRENNEIIPYRFKKNPALVGTLVHQLMEYLIETRNQLNSRQAIDSILNEYNADEYYYRNILNSVIDQIRSGGYPQNNQAPQDILKELLSADEVYCELPFCYQDKEILWRGFMDVVYRKKDQWIIVDYKTNADPSDLDNVYKEQLKAYKKAFKEMTGNDAETMIYHIAV